MIIIKFRCPCNTCLVGMTCKEPCDLFDKFIIPVNKVMQRLEDFFGAIDDMIPNPSKRSAFFDIVGSYVIAPVVFYSLIFTFGIKTHMKERSLFDERYSKWGDTKK